MPRLRSLLVLPALFVGALGGSAQAASIDHTAVGCVVAEQFPRLEARLTPADAIGRARVFFRSEGTPAAWYAVQMKPEGELFAAALPRPKKSLKRFSYYLEVADKSLTTSRTEEYTTQVVSGKGGCAKGMMGTAMTIATVLLEAPAGAAAIPAGFSSAGIVAAGSTATAASGTAAAASGGGGLGTGTIVAGVGAIAAAGAVVAVKAAGGDEGGPAEISGQVFASFGVNPANPTGPGLYSNPVVGGTVSTSIDSVTATTDGQGRFVLRTNTRVRNDECYTITIRAAGLPTYSLNGAWGRNPTNQVYSLSPPQPSQVPQCTSG